MKEYYGNYLGICINSQDPESRGRVQIFIPHIMPALYEGWNESGEDITIECVGNNLPNGLSSDIINKLVQMLPWAEAASPVIGSSVAGAYNPSTGNFNQTSTPEGTISSFPGTSLDNASGLDYIFNSEARRDANGNVQVYNLPSGDGGGAYEVAGINQKYHPQEAAALKGLVEQGKYKEAEARAKNYIGTYTNSAAKLAANPGVDYALRDAAFNRGQGGANWMAKYAAGIEPNLKMNDSARQQILAAQQRDPQGYLGRLREATERYETDVVGVRSQFIKGLTNRWDDRYQNSLSLLNNSKISLNDPASIPTTPPAQAHPFSEPEPQVFVGREPTQSALTDVNASAPVSVGGNNNYENYFNSAAFKDALRARKNHGAFQDENGNWKSGKGTTLCAAGAMITVGTITGSNSIKTEPMGSATALARSSSNVLTNAADSQGNKLYGKQTFPSNYTPQNGDVVAMAGGKKGYGHAIAYLNGKWYAHKAGDHPPEVYLKGGKYNSPALYRLTDAGIAAADAEGVADGSKILPATPSGAFDESVINGIDPLPSGIVKNPTSSITTDMDMTGVPQGMFAYPAPGALLWVFFREGDPLFPVYFAASYGATEWQNAQKASSPPLYGPQAGQQSEFNNQSMFRPNNAGAIVFTDSATSEKNNRTVRVAHANGGYFEMHPTGTTHYSPNEHMQQVAGTNYNYCLNREEWTQGTDNRVTIGNQWVVIGNPSQANFETIEALTEKVKQINAKMLQK